jgi:hypothetical protein
MPHRLPMTHRQMQHEARVVAAMPVRRAGIAPHRVSDVQSPWLSALIAYPARARQDAQQLAFFVRVPEGACAGGEHYVVDVDCWAGVGVDRAARMLAGGRLGFSE